MSRRYERVTLAQPRWSNTASTPSGANSRTRAARCAQGASQIDRGDGEQAPLELAPGDVALVRGGPDHHIAHEPAGTCLPPEQFRARHAGDERSADRRA